jgi:hypothetical protein
VDAKDETIRLLTQQLESERRANEENRRIIAALTSCIPELEASAQEPRESPAGEEGSYHPPSEPQQEPQTATSPPWWRRFLGG